MTRATLESVLRERTGLALSLTITDNERTMISTRRTGEWLAVRVHHMFLCADAATVGYLAGYLDKSDPHAGVGLGRFIDRQRSRIRRPKTRLVRVRSTGSHHDLQAIFEGLNDRYFDGCVHARVSWGRRTSPRSAAELSEGAMRQSIKLGSYRSRDALIRVHPALDAAWVPEYFVAYIVYHEMLHQVVPPESRSGRRSFHSREFRLRERAFHAYADAHAWEQRNLRRLLRA